MRRNRDLLHDLFIESDSTGSAVQHPQQPVVETLPTPKPVTLQVEGYPRHQYQVQPV